MSSIFLEEWPTEKFSINDKEKSIGDILFSLKQPVAKVLDEARNKGKIGSSLDATLTLNVNKNTYNALVEYEDELKFIFITSACKLNIHEADDEFYGDILVETNDNHKCDRCWHKHESVGSIKGHEKLCNRCHDNIFGDGEKRLLG